MAALGSDRDSLWVVGYDVIANVPSGRRLEDLRDGVDVYQITEETTNHPARVAEGLEIGGIDTRFDLAGLPDGIVVAGTNRVVALRPGSPPHAWDTSSIEGREIVEIAFRGEMAAAIVRRTHADRVDGSPSREITVYELAHLTPQGGSVTPITPDGVPFRVRWAESGPTFDLARDPAQLLQVFLYDLGRMPHTGIMDFGGNNLEGRVAWAQCYYLQGMLAVLDGVMGEDAVQSSLAIRDRLRAEIRLVADLVLTPWPGLSCARYSVGREPVRFALHAGRTLQLLARARDILGADTRLDAAIDRLQADLRAMRDFVEEPFRLEHQGRWFDTLRFRTGSPFWADGCNVPYNFCSGVVAGVLAASADSETTETCVSLMRPLLELELQGSYWETWRYWWGVGDRGWTNAEGISINSPSYVGNRGALAHITYRSMDAEALLELEFARRGVVPPSVLGRLQTLTSAGLLCPWVCETLRKVGRPAELSGVAALRHARSSSAWELRSQPWALAELGRLFQQETIRSQLETHEAHRP